MSVGYKDEENYTADGYSIGSTYTREYYRFQAPIYMSFAALENGFPAPDPAKPFKYCDLGCGEGISSLLLAAAYPHAEFIAVDTNPTHIANAKALAEEAGLKNLKFIEADFRSPVIAENGPYDYIAGHGVYSWVSPKVQGIYRDVVNDTLRPGGLMYMCHQVYPGSSRMRVMFDLMKSLMSKRKGSVLEKAAAAIKDLEKLHNSKAYRLTSIEATKEEIEELKTRDKRFLVHEYCNQFLTPCFVSDVFSDMADIGLEYVGSSKFEYNDFKNHFENFRPENFEDASFSETSNRISLLTLESFRWDVFRRADDRGCGEPTTNWDLNRCFLDTNLYAVGFPKSKDLHNRTVNFDVPVFRDLLNVSFKDRFDYHSLLTHPDLAKYPQEEVKQLLRDIVAGYLFFPTLDRPEKVQIEPDTVYRFSHPIIQALAERDFFSEGYMYLPSKQMGAAISLCSFNAMAAMSLNGRSVTEARAHLVTAMANLTKEQYEILELESPYTAKSFDQDWGKFMRLYLPAFIRHGIVVVDK